MYRTTGGRERFAAAGHDGHGDPRAGLLGARFTIGTIVEFDPDVCDHCIVRSHCTTAELGTDRAVAIAENEPLQHRLLKQIQTSAGRAALRERTTIEHKLAHISQRQGTRARYVGVRKNTFDLRRASAIQNLETLHRSEIESRQAA